MRHLLAAWKLTGQTNGNLYAAAITYFSFLALFPLILLAVAVLGFVLHGHPATLQTLFDNVSKNMPGKLGDTVKEAIRTAIDKRTGVGLIGLVGVLLTGLGWIGNLRAAIDAVWGLTPAKRNFVMVKLSNLLVLLGLGLGLAVSLGVGVVGTAVSSQVVSGLGLSGVTGMTLLLKVVAIVLGVAGDFVIFWWLLVRLPQIDVPRAIGVKGALMAAVGFEVLKIVGTYTIAKSAQSPTAGPFASILAVLIWIQLVSRFMLFCGSWMAVLTREQRPQEFAADEPEPGAPGTYIERTDRGVGWGPVIKYTGVGFVLGAVLGRRESRSYRG